MFAKILTSEKNSFVIVLMNITDIQQKKKHATDVAQKKCKGLCKRLKPLHDFDKRRGVCRECCRIRALRKERREFKKEFVNWNNDGIYC